MSKLSLEEIIDQKIGIEDLPNDVLIKICNYLNIKEYIYIVHVSKRFQELSKNDEFLKKINLSEKQVDFQLIKTALNLGVKYLSLRKSKISITVPVNFKRRSNLKYLDLRLNAHNLFKPFISSEIEKGKMALLYIFQIVNSYSQVIAIYSQVTVIDCTFAL